MGVASAFVVGCNCGPGASDAGWPTDAHQCSLEEAEAITPNERASSIGGNQLLRLFGANRVGSGASGLEGRTLEDGSLLTNVEVPAGLESESLLVRIREDGQAIGIYRGEGGLGLDGESAANMALFATDQLGGDIEENPELTLTLFGLDGGGPLATSAPEILFCQGGIKGYSANVSAGRLLLLRWVCPGPDRSYYNAVERWERRGEVLERVAGPYPTLEPGDEFLGQRSTHADGRGGLYWIGVGAIEGATQAAVYHWDGDGEPTRSEPIPTDGWTHGALLSSGDYVAVVNRGSRSRLLRVRPDGSTVWTWEPPSRLHSGPDKPTLAAVGDDEVVVLLWDPASPASIWADRLDVTGTSVWGGPRQLEERIDTGRREVVDLTVAGHVDGSFHAMWVDTASGVRVRAYEASGLPRWPEVITAGGDIIGGRHDNLLLADADGGVWVLANSFYGEFQHLDRDGWPLFRTLTYPGCGRRGGFIARASPDAEPIEYLGTEFSHIF